MTNQEIQDQLKQLAPKYRGKIVIADFFQLLREGNNFLTENGKLKRKSMPIEWEHFEATNSQCLNSGKLYVINEKKTEAWQEKLQKHKDEIGKRDKAQQLGAKKLSDALAGMAGVEDEDEETDGFKARQSKNEKQQVFGVEVDGSVNPIKGEVIKANWLFTGTEKECEKYVEKEYKK